MQPEQLRMMAKRIEVYFVAAEDESAAHALLRNFAAGGDGHRPAAVCKNVASPTVEA
jgi:hypothetical protein